MLTLKTLPALALTALALSACAQGPDAIAPIPMGNAYATADCRQVAADLANERAALDALETKQRGTAAGDALGVFLIGVPVSSLTGGDVSGAIAAAKGKVMALEARLDACAA